MSYATLVELAEVCVLVVLPVSSSACRERLIDPSAVPEVGVSLASGRWAAV